MIAKKRKLKLQHAEKQVAHNVHSFAAAGQLFYVAPGDEC
jgi:hypothetical protein